MANTVTTHPVVQGMTPFVWSVVGKDANETLEHIDVRKEAERNAGAGEFWWGLGSSLGQYVEAIARQHKRTLPALFSKSKSAKKQASNRIRIWNEWRSVLHPRQRGRIPNHVVVTSGHGAKRQSDVRFALICHSNVKLALGSAGFCDLAQCRTLRSGEQVGHLRASHLLVFRSHQRIPKSA
jgi:hypothetical protein